MIVHKTHIQVYIMLRISHAKYLIFIIIIILRGFNVFFYRISMVLLNLQLSIFENTVDPEKLASDEAIWLVSVLFSTLIELHAYKLIDAC